MGGYEFATGGLVFSAAFWKVLGTVIACLIAWAAKSMAARFGIQATDAQISALKSIAEIAVQAAEEWAVRNAKANPDGNMKKDRAVAIVREATGVDVATATNHVDAALARIPGIGATGANTYVLDGGNK
ncbi:MAG: hypothetical protein HQK89_17805 [Nitrospirae bacterium]|nr:hypothetical protein [Nitrospirota bacterium]